MATRATSLQAQPAPPTITPSKPPWWRNPTIRGLIIQVVFFAAVFGLIAWLLGNTFANLERQGIASGFGFLDRPAGFAINQALIPFDNTSSHARVFWVGLLNTLLVSGAGILAATILGFIIGIARLSSNWLIARLAAVYVEIIRNVPLLLQILFWYVAVLSPLPSPRDLHERGEELVFSLNNRGLFVPEPAFGAGIGLIFLAFLLGVALALLWGWQARRHKLSTGKPRPVLLPSLGLVLGLPALAFLITGAQISFNYPTMGGFRLTGGLFILPEFVALWLALSLYTASFIAEIVRAGILAIDKGQWEAAGALGLRRGQTLRMIVIPQAMRVIVPPLTSQYLNLTKNSSLGAAIAYPELVSQFAGTTLNITGQALEVLLITGAVYMTISLTIAVLMNIFNARIALKER